MTDYPALWQLFGAYLTYDWPEDYGDLWTAVNDFTRREPIAAELPAEVERLLSAGHDEPTLRTIIVDDMGSGYFPVAERWTAAYWLSEIARHVRATLDAQADE